MTTEQHILVVKHPIVLELPKSYIAEFRENSADGLKDYTDEQILEALAEDILLRYFNTEYFDVEAVVQALS